MRLLQLSAIALALAASTAARATEFHLTYATFDDGVTGPAVSVDALVTADADGFGDNGYFVTGISGTRGSEALSFNDNLDEIYYPANADGDVVDSFGLTFFAGGTLYQFYKNGRGDFAYHEYDGSAGRIVYADTVSLTEVAATAVPEPAGWATMIAGAALVGAALRRRRRHNRLAA